jgi:hypothetical protein
MDAGVADSVDRDAAAEPGTTENVVTAVSGPEEAVTLIGPASWPTMVTEATPPVDVFAPRPETLPEPDVFVKVTGEAAAVRFPEPSRSSTVRILADPDERAPFGLVKRIAAAVPATTANDDDAEASPGEDAVIVIEPAPVPVTVIDAVPAEVFAAVRPDTDPVPPDWTNEIVRPESLATRWFVASSTRTSRVSVPPATRSVEAEEKRRWSAGSAWKVTVAVAEIGLPPMVPLIVAVPGDVGAVRVAA